MKVLILGASGFIGLPVAQAFVRAGHTVYGVTRSAAKAKSLAAEEIIPIVGDPESADWPKLVPTLDVIVEALGGSANVPKISPSLLALAARTAQATRPPGAPRIAYLYTSGTWVHGDSRTALVSDTTPLPAEGTPLVAWRPALEQAVIHEQALNGIVIRPSLVYGRSGSITALLFGSALGGTASLPGTPGGRYATVHADDLADVYVRAAERAPLVKGLIFDATNEASESVDDLLQRTVAVTGAKGYAYTTPSNAFEIALAQSSILRPYLARSLLGWAPRKPSLVDGLEQYFNSFLAAAEGEGPEKVLKARLGF